ncbi:MAG: GAF domain-containing SpoIIE family protein phosphatase [Pseudomonadota bacterium]
MSKAVQPALPAAAGKALSELDVLVELGQELAQSIDIEATLKRAVQRIAGYMEAEAASVFLVDPSGGELECRACAGPVDVSGLRIRMGQGIVGRAARDNLCQLVRDVRNDPDFAGNVDARTGFQTRSILCTPLRTSGGVIGVLQVLNKLGGGLFGDHDRETLRVLASPTALAINNARMASDLVEQKRIRKELFLARRLQRSLLPQRRPAPFPVQGINLPAREVSGDFFDFFDLPDGRIGFSVGDVSGKGMNAALLMVRATSLLRWIGKSGLAPGQWLAQVNNELVESVSGGMFICAVAGYLDPAQGRVTWANAGFPPPILHAAGETPRRYPAKAPPLAIIEQSEYETETLEIGASALYFYSDGVTEARSADGEMLNEEGLEALIEACAGGPAKPRLGRIINRLRKHDLVDDTTLMIVEGLADR